MIKERSPDKTQENQEDKYSLESAMEELSQHLTAKDWKSAAECFKEAAKMVDEEPHKEGPHVEPHSYAASKE